MRQQILPLLIVFLLCWNIQAFDIQIPVHYDTLENGLRVILVPDTNSAVVSCKLYYFTGSMYEGPGTSGLSHLYEHMMFKGTQILGTKDYEKEISYMKSIDSLDMLIGQLRQKGIPETDSLFSAYRTQIFSLLDKQRQYIVKDEIWEMYENNGGTNLNAWTGDDMTAYIVTLPKNKLELYFWIESDRMKNPILREFYSERDVVTEERRMRYGNRPLSRYWQRFTAQFYTAHPYRLPTIGWMSDIRAYTRKKLYDHINRFYTPDNGLLVLVGNIEIQEIMSQIKLYFEHIPRAKIPKEEVVTREPAPIGETRFTVYDNVQPRIDILYHTPGYPHEDLYVLDVIEGILTGRSGRLYKRLVNEEKLCINTGAANAYKLHDGYFFVYANLKNNADAKRVEEIILEELDKVITHPPTLKEMERIKNTIQMGFTTRLKSMEGLSDQLAWFERLGTWKDLIEYPENIDNVTSDKIPAIAKKYFNHDLKTIGLLLPKKSDRNSNTGQENSAP